MWTLRKLLSFILLTSYYSCTAKVLLNETGNTYNSADAINLGSIEICDDMQVSFLITVGDSLGISTWDVPFNIGPSLSIKYGTFCMSQLHGFIFEVRVTQNPNWPGDDPNHHYTGHYPQIGEIYAIKAIYRNSNGSYQLYFNNHCVMELTKPLTPLPISGQSQPVWIGYPNALSNGNHNISNLVIECLPRSSTLLNETGKTYNSANAITLGSIEICNDMEISFEVTVGDQLNRNNTWDSPLAIGYQPPGTSCCRYGYFYMSHSLGFLFEVRTIQNNYWPLWNDSHYTPVPGAIYSGQYPQIGETYSIKLIYRNSNGSYQFYFNEECVVELVKPQTILPDSLQPVQIGQTGFLSASNGNHNISNLGIKCLNIATADPTMKPTNYPSRHPIQPTLAPTSDPTLSPTSVAVMENYGFSTTNLIIIGIIAALVIVCFILMICKHNNNQSSRQRYSEYVDPESFKDLIAILHSLRMLVSNVLVCHFDCLGLLSKSFGAKTAKMLQHIARVHSHCQLMMIYSTICYRFR